MGTSLVIVESPAKARTINKILGSDFVIKASMGHVRDLPAKEFGVDLKNRFHPKYVMIKGRKSVIDDLKKVARKSDRIYLAPDPDREGEAIAWHLRELLDGAVEPDRFYRVSYQEITAPAIRKAFEQPEALDMNKVNAQQARRVLDRLVGYMVSPLLWRRVRGASSAGRVQSVALRLICEREKEIEDFVSEEFWTFGAQVAKQEEPREPFSIRLTRINGEKPDIKNAAQATALEEALKDCALTVSSVQRREVRKKAQPPFITSTLQQAGSRAFGLTPSRTMQVAQKLYEGSDFGEGASGLITYMRTDSFNVSNQAAASARSYIEQQYGKEYVPEKPNRYRSRSSAQEAHEAIRPTEVTRTPASIKGQLPADQWKLYRLIWERFVASQMAPAVIAQRSVEIETRNQRNDTCLFRASTSEVQFPGYMKVTGIEKKASTQKGTAKNGDEEEESEKLPELAEGEKLDLVEWLKEQKFTQPPARFSESSLIRALEENGVGRPSTYASIISVLYNRKYMEKQKRSIHPTELGRRVNNFLVEHLNALFDVHFTADMEGKLDRVEEGKVEWVDMLDSFYGRFQDWLEKAKGPKVERSAVSEWLPLFDEVKEWEPPIKRGKRTYSDQKFIDSLKRKLDQDDAAFTQRQLDAIKRVAWKYREQAPALALKLEACEYKPPEKDAGEPPRESTKEKLEALKKVTFDPPRTVGKRTYNDAEFCESLRGQVNGGRRLTANQIRYLDQLALKYREQIPDFEQVSTSWELNDNGTNEPVGEWLKLMEGVAEWKPPVKRGKSVWDDRQFFESLNRQYKDRRTLSPRQAKSLKKMVKKYADQIPDYEDRKDEWQLV